MVKIEKMTEKHIAQVAEIEESIFSVPWSKNAFKDSLELENTAFYVAIKEENVVGYCGVYKVLNSADITNVAVKKEERKKGVAEQMLKEAIKDAKNEGIKEIMLEVRESNEAAISLYKKNGFESITKRKKYYRNPVEDAIIMLLKI